MDKECRDGMRLHGTNMDRHGTGRDRQDGTGLTTPEAGSAARQDVIPGRRGGRLQTAWPNSADLPGVNDP